MSEIIHNVRDGRYSWIGSWEVVALRYDELTEADIGRTVIYRDHGRAEAGTLSSFKNGVVFARYSRGDTAAGADPANLVFGIKRTDKHPNTPPTPGEYGGEGMTSRALNRAPPSDARGNQGLHAEAVKPQGKE